MGDLDAIGLRSADALRACEAEILAMMAAALVSADLEADPYGALADVTAEAARIASRHRPLVLDAIDADLRAAGAGIGQGDGAGVENAAQRNLGGF